MAPSIPSRGRATGIDPATNGVGTPVSALMNGVKPPAKGTGSPPVQNTPPSTKALNSPRSAIAPLVQLISAARDGVAAMIAAADTQAESRNRLPLRIERVLI